MKPWPEKILVLDSDTLIHKLAYNYLTQKGSDEVACYSDVDEAMEYLTVREVDLIILDWRFKKPSGREIYLNLRALPGYETTEVLLISGGIRVEDISFVREKANTRFLAKPFTEDVFISVLSKSFKLLTADEIAIKLRQRERPKTGRLAQHLGNTENNNKRIPTARSDGLSSLSADSDLFHLKGKKTQNISSNINKYTGHGSTLDYSSLRLRVHLMEAREKRTQVSWQNNLLSGARPQWMTLHLYEQLMARYPEAFHRQSPQSDNSDSNIKQPHRSAAANQISKEEVLSSSVGLQTQLVGESSESAEQEEDVLSLLVDESSGRAMETSVDLASPTSSTSEVPYGGTSPATPAKSEHGKCGNIKPRQKPIEASASLPHFPKATKDASAIGQQSEETEGKALTLFRINCKNIKNCLIIDHDQATQNFLISELESFGIRKFTVASDGNSAWRYISEQKNELIILDWKIPRLRGLTLYNRLRKSPTLRNTPTIILVGQLQLQDFRILEECHATMVAEKPLRPKRLGVILASLVDRCEHYNHAIDSAERAFEAVLKGGEKLDVAISRIGPSAAGSLTSLLTLAENFFAAGDLEKAHRVANGAYQVNKNHTGILSLLAKIYHRLNMPERALELVNRAQGISPQNIERLCLLGELNLNLQDSNQARDYFKKALELDSQDEVANAGLVLSDNINSFVEEHQKSETKVDIGSSFASMLNIIGITFIRNGEFDKGIHQYQAALSFVYDRFTLSRLQFNLGMAFLRNKQLEKAEHWFRSAIENDPSYAKANKFLHVISKNRGVEYQIDEAHELLQKVNS